MTTVIVHFSSSRVNPRDALSPNTLNQLRWEPLIKFSLHGLWAALETCHLELWATYTCIKNGREKENDGEYLKLLVDLFFMDKLNINVSDFTHARIELHYAWGFVFCWIESGRTREGPLSMIPRGQFSSGWVDDCLVLSGCLCWIDFSILVNLLCSWTSKTLCWGVIIPCQCSHEHTFRANALVIQFWMVFMHI